VLDLPKYSDYSTIQEILYLKELFDKLWEMVTNFNALNEKWMNGPLIEINANQVEQEV
jgi:dynein heavy chain